MGSPADFERLRGNHPLAVYLDRKSPYAYLAVEPTRAMAAKLGVLLVEKVFGDGSGAAFSTWAPSAGVKVAQSLASDLEARDSQVRR